MIKFLRRINWKKLYYAQLERNEKLALEISVKRHFETPAPCDGEWVARFAVLETDYRKLETEWREAIRKNSALHWLARQYAYEMDQLGFGEVIEDIDSKNPFK